MSPAPWSVWCAEWSDGPREDQPRLRVALAPDGTVPASEVGDPRGANTRAKKTERVERLQDLLASGEAGDPAEATKFLSVKSRNSVKC